MILSHLWSLFLSWMHHECPACPHISPRAGGSHLGAPAGNNRKPATVRRQQGPFGHSPPENQGSFCMMPNLFLQCFTLYRTSWFLWHRQALYHSTHLAIKATQRGDSSKVMQLLNVGTQTSLLNQPIWHSTESLNGLKKMWGDRCDIKEWEELHHWPSCDL